MTDNSVTQVGTDTRVCSECGSDMLRVCRIVAHSVDSYKSGFYFECQGCGKIVDD